MGKYTALSNSHMPAVSGVAAADVAALGEEQRVLSNHAEERAQIAYDFAQVNQSWLPHQTRQLLAESSASLLQKESGQKVHAFLPTRQCILFLQEWYS